EERQYITAFDRAWADFHADHDRLIALVQAGQLPEAVAFYRSGLRDKFYAMLKPVEAAMALNVREGRKAADTGAAVFQAARLWIMIAVA
ncbi:MCP four helix bundle domain-containing protein, partial [Acinetobacter baumannii]